MPTRPGPTSAHLPINSLALRRGGLVAAVIRRANALVSEGIETWIEVLGAQSWLEREAANMRRSGHLDDRVRTRRVLDGLDRSPLDHSIAHFVPAEGTQVQRSDRLVDVVADGLLVQRITLAGGRRFRFADDYGRDGTRWRRLELDGSGRVVRDCRYKPGQSIASTHQWVGRDGSTFLTVEVDPQTREWTGAYYRRNGELVHTGDMGLVYAEAFSRALDETKRPLVFSEFRENLANFPVSTIDDAIRKIEHPAIRRAVVVHSNHLSSPYSRGSAVSPTWQNLINHEAAWDAFVVWTEDQRADLIEQFNLQTPVMTMPPYSPKIDDPTSSKSPANPDRIVTVARMQRKKRVDLAISAFAKFSETRPSARLEIFGFGYADAHEEAVRKLVDELGVSEKVTFKDFSPRPGDLYDGACALLMTSESEGFGQVILESMAHGVPVVAFDVNYGPRTVIEDGRNGYLVAFGDVRAAAERLSDLAENPENRARISGRALATAAQFTPQNFARDWADVCRTIANLPAGPEHGSIIS